MAIIRWNPWTIDNLMNDDWDVPTIPGLSRLAGQGLNLYETDKAIVAEAALPGIPEENVDVTFDNGIVQVVGSADQKTEENSKRRNFMSTLSSSYNYSFRLPEGMVKDQEPSCELSDGILTMTFPKIEKTAPKKLKVTKKNGAKRKE